LHRVHYATSHHRGNRLQPGAALRSAPPSGMGRRKAGKRDSRPDVAAPGQPWLRAITDVLQDRRSSVGSLPFIPSRTPGGEKRASFGVNEGLAQRGHSPGTFVWFGVDPHLGLLVRCRVPSFALPGEARADDGTRDMVGDESVSAGPGRPGCAIC